MKRVYLVGIGGIAMANLAILLKQKGCLVSGSDAGVFGPSKKLLKESDIKFFNSYNSSNIIKFKPNSLIIGNAIGRGNQELEYILNNQLPYCSMPEIIREEILQDKKPIVVAGTSGKTTTASLLAWILKESDLKPTVLVGGTIKNLDSGFMNGSGKYAVIEGDEYNSSFYDSCPKFLHYRPYHAIITNIQMDHLEIYGNIQNIFKAFQKLTKLIPSSGSLVLNKGNDYTSQIIKESRAKVTTFGKKADLEAKKISYNSEGISFQLLKRDKRLGIIKSHLLGNHNVENILAAIALGLKIKIPFSKIIKAISSFAGVKRRLEIICQKGNITVIDDFAHNPEKVSASLSALKKHFPKHHIIAVFEPRTGSSRRKFFQNTYPDSFTLADTVYITEPFKKEALKTEELLSSRQLAKDLNKKGIKSYVLATADQIIKHISQNLSQIKTKPTIIVVMTSGEFDNIHQKLMKLIK